MRQSNYTLARVLTFPFEEKYYWFDDEIINIVPFIAIENIALRKLYNKDLIIKMHQCSKTEINVVLCEN